MTAPQFWAEDAVVFYAEAERTGASSLSTPYAGYFHAAPRLIALAGRASGIPIVWLPTLYVAGALALTVVALYLIHEAHAHLSLARRWLATAVPLLVPFSQEILGVLTNVQWLLALVLVAAYAAPPSNGRAGRAMWVIVLALALLSGPFSLILLPAAAVALALRRDAWALWLGCAQAAAACLTIVPLLSSRRPGADATGFSAVHGLMVAIHDRPRMTVFWLGLAALLLLALIDGLRRRTLCVALPAACGLLVLGATLLAGPRELLAAFPAGGGRYLFIPWVCVTWSLLSILPARRALVKTALCAMLAMSARFYWFAPSPRYDWRAAAECLEREAFCETTIVPGWHIGLPGRGEAPAVPPP